MNPSTALATVLVDALSRTGVRHLVLCPGSRSAPLAYAAERADSGGRLRLHVRVDERSAGFLAMGLAKEDGAPAAVVTTSGTAAANLHPAVLEAAHAGVPLVVLTADRPHELRGTGANQTTDQVKLFGTAVRRFAEIPAPERRPDQAAGWRATASRLVAAAAGVLNGDPGPVHLNVAFREPLVPDLEGHEWLEPLDGDTGITRVVSPSRPVPIPLDPGPRTVVVAGDGAGAAARELAEAAGWPLLAEPSSDARSGSNAIAAYRLLLDLPRLGGRIQRAVVVGRPTLSRPVARLLARADVEVVVVSPRPDWVDVAANARLVVPAAAAEPHEPGWVAQWRTAGDAALAAVDAVLEADVAAREILNGPLVAREVATAVEPGSALYVGSSNPVRDLDLTAPPFRDGVRVLANRGLSGIDGTLSSASGVALARSAAGRPTPVRCLVGDLTFLHDVGGLLIGPTETRPHLQVVVADDGGGGIFGLLEQGEVAARGRAEANVFERLFGTPHGVDVGAICAGYGVAYQRAEGVAELRKVLADPAPGTSVVHVPIDRAGQRDLAQRVREAVRAAVDV